MMKKLLPFLLLWAMACTAPPEGPVELPARPNILFAISDDQSWPHAGAYGTDFMQTPTFDRLAREGVLFHNAFVTSPGCAPSRASMVLGRYPWQLGQAGNHASTWPGDLKTLPDYLQEAGYHTGYTGKGVGPHFIPLGGRPTNPAGPEYNLHESEVPYEGIRKTDYAANFAQFLDEKEEGEPFFFWYGASEPHRKYQFGAGKLAGFNPDEIAVPPFLPNTDTVRQDLADYAMEVQWFDSHLGQMLQLLQERGELENTLIIVTADNGMPFPAAKANCFELGIHVPLVAWWGENIAGGRAIDDPVSLVDLLPTLTDVAGATLPQNYPLSGKSWRGLLQSRESGYVDPERKAILSGRERHSSSRWAHLTYPQRAIRTADFLFIRNFHPERWPAGAPAKLNGNGQQVPAYPDIDYGPTLQYYYDHKQDENLQDLMALALAKRPEFELYDIRQDPWCLNNLAGHQDYKAKEDSLLMQLQAQLKETGDFRLSANPDAFERHPRHSPLREFPVPDWAKQLGQDGIAYWAGLHASDSSLVVPPDSLTENLVRLRGWELYQNGDDWRLFDLNSDPQRQHNLNSQMKSVAGQLRRYRDVWKERMGR